jgi:hypothetical protein
MNTQKIRAHAKTVAKFDLAVADSTQTSSSHWNRPASSKRKM